MNDNYLIKTHRKRLMIIIFAVLSALTVFIISIISGTVKFEFFEVINGIFFNSDNPVCNQIIHNIRLPRILIGFLAGMNLAAAGALLQGVLRNPLAAPQIIGVNAGAGLAAVIFMIFFAGQIYLIPYGAFLGSLLAALLVYKLSTFSGSSSTVHIVLAGVAVSAFLNAITSGLMMLNSDELAITYLWLLGSLSGRGWEYFNLLLPYSILGLSISILISPKINLFNLGDEVGTGLGLSVKVYKMIVILLSAILAGSAVSVVGTIGFVGLIAPHLARILVGNDYRYSIILSTVLGGTLLVISDTVSRTLFRPVELSVGIVTSFIGAPFFLFLLYSKKKSKLY